MSQPTASPLRVMGRYTCIFTAHRVGIHSQLSHQLTVLISIYLQSALKLDKDEVFRPKLHQLRG